MTDKQITTKSQMIMRIAELSMKLQAKEQECEELKYHVDFVNNMNDTYCKQLNCYRQALAEIKEIAERCGKRIPLFEIDEIAEDLKQILHKIYEVEDENM